MNGWGWLGIKQDGGGWVVPSARGVGGLGRANEGGVASGWRWSVVGEMKRG